MSIECLVYWARPRDARPRHRELFTDAERGRADAYRREVDRDRFAVGCALSRIALGRLLSMEPAAVPLLRDCSGCGQPHGRPRVLPDGIEPDGRPRTGEPAFVSVSHSGDHVVVAVTRAGPIGVDVEQHRPEALDLADTVLTGPERAALAALPESERVAGFFGYWTRKEATLKAVGRGLTVPMTSIEPTQTGGVTVLNGDAELAAALAGLRLIDLDAGAGHSAALATTVAPSAAPRPVRLDGGALLRGA